MHQLVCIIHCDIVICASVHDIILLSCAREGHCSSRGDPFPMAVGEIKKKKCLSAHVAVRVRCGMRDDGRPPRRQKQWTKPPRARFVIARRRRRFPQRSSSTILLYRLILFVGIAFIYFFRFVFIVVVVRSLEIPQTTRLLFLYTV